MATLLVDGATVGYAVEGTTAVSGIPLLLFHGTTMNRTAWDMVRAALPADTFRFVLVEFPGSGESSMPTEPLTVDRLVSQALAVMDHLGFKTFHVAGYSLGAVIALATAAAAPARVSSVTSLCGWTVADARMRLTFDLWKRLIAADKELFVRYTLVDGFTVAGIAIAEPMIDMMAPLTANLIAPGSQAHLDLNIALDITNEIPKITSRTLIIGAIDDRWVDVTHSRTLATAIPGATLIEVPAGHLVIQELAVDIAHLIRQHIYGTWSRAEQFAPLPPDIAARWERFASGDRVVFPKFLGIQVLEVRTDYCRMLLPFKPELEQLAGLVHGGVIASLLDTVVVPAVGAAYGPEARYSTVDMHTQFIGAVVTTDIIAEGWVVRRGRSVVFCESEAINAATGKLVARSLLTYNVSGNVSGNVTANV